MTVLRRALGFAGVNHVKGLKGGAVLSTAALVRRFASQGVGAAAKGEALSLVEVDYHELRKMTPSVLQKLRAAYIGPQAIGAVAVVNIPGYGDRLTKAFRAGIDLALTDPEGRKRAAAVSNTYPGWSGTPGTETHPLQSSFLFNAKEVIPGGKTNPYFGKSIFPTTEYRDTFVDLVTPMHDASLEVLRGLDLIIEEELGKQGLAWSDAGRSLRRLASDGPALASRFICYDSEFTREDTLLSGRNSGSACALTDEEVGPQPLTIRTAGHAEDGLASMRTHSTPVKSAGHAGDGLASMRTHSTPVKSAGHAGDGLASMRTHSTPVKSAGHAGDGLASMRTHSTPVKSAGHAGDGLASMRTHSTPVKSAGHAGDGLASMRTHSTPVKSAGHAGDGLASMRTHSTFVKSAGFNVQSTARKSTAMTSDNASLPSNFVRPTVESQVAVRQHMTQSASVGTDAALVSILTDTATADTSIATENEAGDYWLPWHIDSNFVTVLHKERYASEANASFVAEPEGAGLMVMTPSGEMAKAQVPEDAMLLQIGAFAQIYSGGVVNACRHAVTSPRPPGISRFNFCNFWYVPWDTVCDAPAGREAQAVSSGWNAMMDSSYLDITMRQGFAAFRKFMTSPEARMQFQDSVHFKELSELLPLPPRSLCRHSATNAGSTELVVDVLTDVRCPFSFLSQLNLDTALRNMGLSEKSTLRYHPVFLNPNVPKDGENLDDYLLREYGYTQEFAHSENYPLRVAGLKAGVELNPHRRVINTFDAFVLLDAAQESGKQYEAVKALSRRYFELAEDISDPAVLAACAAEAGLPAEEVPRWLDDNVRRARVQASYEELSATIGEVPHFLLRERVSGHGLEIGGNRSVEEWEMVLEGVLEKARFVGMVVPGPYGSEVRLAEANPNAPVSLSFSAQHGWATSSWPYTPEDFSRIDESADTGMYEQPRLVNHLDASSLERLKEVYRAAFSSVQPGFAVLDLCSSWISHFPTELLEGARVTVHGLNQAELDVNAVATERHMQDLNANARLPWNDNSFDFVTMALSVQYLTDPRAVFAEMNRVLKPGGMAIITHSHRCFIEKAVRLFAAATDDGEGHTHHICSYFRHGPEGGWEGLATVDSSPQHGDPVWIATAVKSGFSN